MATVRKGTVREPQQHSSRTTQRRKRLSMHDGIAPWCDCCVCEAEPYWADVAKEMGIELSNYEEEQK